MKIGMKLSMLELWHAVPRVRATRGFEVTRLSGSETVPGCQSLGKSVFLLFIIIQETTSGFDVTRHVQLFFRMSRLATHPGSIALEIRHASTLLRNDRLPGFSKYMHAPQ